MVLATHVYIEAPTVAPAAGGLYAVAEVRDNADPHIGASGVTYLSENCGVASSLEDPACLTADARATKTFGEIDVIAADPFGVYKGVECTYMGDDDSDWARRGLELTEHIAVEQALPALLFAGATDLTPSPGTPLTVTQGIALLEGWAGANYGGTPVLHMDRQVAAIGLAETVLINDLNYTITTKQGSLVANGGGYLDMADPSGAAPAAGEAWIYITGAVVVTRTPVFTTRVVPGTDADGGRLNLQRALAERMIAVTAECILAAVLVEVEVV